MLSSTQFMRHFCSSSSKSCFHHVANFHLPGSLFWKRMFQNPYFSKDLSRYLEKTPIFALFLSAPDHGLCLPWPLHIWLNIGSNLHKKWKWNSRWRRSEYTRNKKSDFKHGRKSLNSWNFLIFLPVTDLFSLCKQNTYPISNAFSRVT